MSPRPGPRLKWFSFLPWIVLLTITPLSATPPTCDETLPNLGEPCTAGLGVCEATGVVVCTDLGIGTIRVKDIRPGPEASDPEYLTNINGTVFFYADDGTHGRELWKSDGTEAGTVMVKDINPGPDGSDPGLDHLRNVNGTLFFYADDGVNGEELWKSDGTEAGTVMVKDIWPGSASSRQVGAEHGGGAFVVFNDALYFWANDGSVGDELWRSDGTEAGTVLVKDINPGFADSLWWEFAYLIIDDILYFGARDEVHGIELWRTDGTTAGTEMVADIFPGTDGSLSDADIWANLDGDLVFSAADSVGVMVEPWKSDGTEQGTELVKDIAPGSTQGSFPAEFVALNETVLFRVFGGSSELWKTDGTEQGTVSVGSVYYPDDPVNALGAVFFRGYKTDTGYELWRSDGTFQGTTVVKDINPGSEDGYPVYMTEMNGALFFRAGDGTGGGTLWRTDGTEAGTVLLDPDLHAGEMINADGTLFINGYDTQFDWELWISDGTVDGTHCDAVLGTANAEVCGDFLDNDCDGSIDEGDALDASVWYLDTDGDTFGDPERPTTACAPLAGFVADATDCNDADDQAWALPGEARDLVFLADKTTLSWSAPTTLGGTSVLYDTIRSENPEDFESIATCVEEDDGSDTTAIDSEIPLAGVAHHYLVGAENSCGRGSLGTEREARVCP